MHRPRLRRFPMLVAAAMLLGATDLRADDSADAVRKAAIAQQPQVLETLKTLVSMESGTMDAPGLARVADYLQGRLSALGAQVERRSLEGVKGEVVIGRYTGTGARRLMLIAHMDTIYAPGTLATEPIRVENDRLYGPGVADSKGGIAVVLHSLQLLREIGWKDYAQLTILFNGDEESQSAGSGDLIAALGSEHDFVLSYEPTAAKSVLRTEGVLLAAAGTGTVVLEVKGRAAHAGAAPDEGRNALIELSHQILQTSLIATQIPGAQLNWTQASSGSVRNQIPDFATASADLRLTAPDAAARLQQQLDKLALVRQVPDTEVRYTVRIGRPPFASFDGRSLELAKKARVIYSELDGRPLIFLPATGAGTDAGFASRSGKPAVLESLGLAGWGYHAKNEYIEIDSIVPRLYLTTRLLMDLGRGD